MKKTWQGNLSCVIRETYLEAQLTKVLSIHVPSEAPVVPMLPVTDSFLFIHEWKTSNW